MKVLFAWIVESFVLLMAWRHFQYYYFLTLALRLSCLHSKFSLTHQRFSLPQEKCYLIHYSLFGMLCAIWFIISSFRRISLSDIISLCFTKLFSSKFLHFSLIKFSMVFSLSFYIFISVSTVYTTVTSTSYFYGHIFLYGTNKSTTAFF